MNKAVQALRLKNAALAGDTESFFNSTDLLEDSHTDAETIVSNHWSWRKGIGAECDCAYCAWLAHNCPVYLGLVIDKA